jgi:YYY domain-containing protein
MIGVMSWYTFSLVLALINLPLAYAAMKKLPSRGIFLLRPLGLLLWGSIFWWLTSIQLLLNDLASQVTALMILVGLNVLVLSKIDRVSFFYWIKENKNLLIRAEIIFLIGFVLMAVVRAANPEIINTEKFMEMAFINAILKSPGFPPMDPWLSGYSISYYYFGYLLSAMLIRITGVSSSVGYNLVAAFWFGMTAVGAYGILWDLLGLRQQEVKSKPAAGFLRKRKAVLALLAPLMILVMGNWFSGLDMLHARGVLPENVWEQLDIPELTREPNAMTIKPQRGGWSWWQASRVVQDRTLDGRPVELIDEFPAFTYLLADIHPHMLSMPLVLLAIAQALNAFMGGWEGNVRLGRVIIPASGLTIALGVLTLGGIGFMNTWDFPFYLLLMGAAFMLYRARTAGWSGKRFWELVGFGIVGGVLSVVAFLPFYLSFSSQAGGVIPSLAFFTKGKYFWIMFGPLLLPIFGLLVSNVKQISRLSWMNGLWVTLSVLLVLFIFGWVLGLAGTQIEMTKELLLGLHGASSAGELLKDSLLNRLIAPGTWITLFLLIWAGISLLLEKIRTLQTEDVSLDEGVPGQLPLAKPIVFVLLMVLLGATLALVPEFLYLRDQFGWRMNTIFKFYFQAWILWSLAGGYALVTLFEPKVEHGKQDRWWLSALMSASLLAGTLVLSEFGAQKLGTYGSSALDYLMLLPVLIALAWLIVKAWQKDWKKVMGVVAVFGVLVGMAFPLIEGWNKTNGFNPTRGFSLDGKRDFYLSAGDEMEAAEWLAEAPTGVMTEAISDTGGSYTTYNSISTFSGMPTVLGWVGHEAQWRGGYEEIGSRQADVRELYSTSKWERAQAIIDMYNIRYIVLGNTERSTYQVDQNKFDEHLVKVFDSQTVDIYEVMP